MSNERADLLQLNEKVKGYEYFNINSPNRCRELDIAFNKLYDLYYIVGGANFKLIEAADNKLSLDGYTCNSEELLRTFLRYENLKSCILSYNSVQDYVIQSILFGFNIKRVKIKGKKDFYNASRDNYYKDVITLIKKSNVEGLYVLVKKYNDCYDIKRLRKLANSIKHGYCFRIDELPRPSRVGYEEVGEYKSDWIEPRVEKLEDLLNLCWRVNNIIVNYVNDIYEIFEKEYKLYLIN